MLPVLLLAGMCVAQAAVAGWTMWSAGGVARIGAREQALGGDARRAVRESLPAMLARGHRVAVGDAGTDAGLVTVRLKVPSLVPGLDFGRVGGRAQLPDQVGA